jgi:YVTN family beta-propeller protein
MSSHRKSSSFGLFGLVVLTLLSAGVLWMRSSDRPRRATYPATGALAAVPVVFQRLGPDPFDAGVAWINTGGPIKFRELRGKIVLLDFWTYCCINCHHMLPALAKLEEKYKNELVVIGIHTPKFPAEQNTENIRRKVREYGIRHPVINDAEQQIWNGFGVSSWPTLMVFGPRGEPLAKQSGEVTFEVLDEYIGKVVRAHKAELNLAPIQFFPENEKPDNTPLLFPGKIVADAEGKRLFIADTGHNRIVITSLEGKNPVVIGAGSAGMTDGSYEKAEFHRPQGMSLLGQTLYVADTENHAIRALDLQAKSVKTVAGTGRQAQLSPRGSASGAGLHTALSSPWDLLHLSGSKVLYVAMAGPHQIWRFDTESGRIGPWAGTGMENILDGPIGSAAFAQPSGLATDGANLFVADSEVSGVRAITLGNAKHVVRSIVGQGLFEFGDIDGRGDAVRLQHCLGLASGDGKLYIADTYNNKVKVCDPKTRSVKTLIGTGKPGDHDSPAEFYQPGGLSLAGSTLYVADTNNHKIRAIDVGAETVSTIPIESLSAPHLRPRAPTFPNAMLAELPKVEIAPGKELTLDVTLPIPSGYKLNKEGSMPYLVETAGIESGFPPTGKRIENPSDHFKVIVPLAKPAAAGDKFDLKLSVQAGVCSEGSNFCTIKSYVWTVPVSVAEQGAQTITIASAGK